MSDRGFLFLFSVLVVLASLGASGWLLYTGQAGSVDGLFLFLTCLVVGFSFSLYLIFMIRRALVAVSPAPKMAKTAPQPAAPAQSKPAPVAQ